MWAGVLSEQRRQGYVGKNMPFLLKTGCGRCLAG